MTLSRITAERFLRTRSIFFVCCTAEGLRHCPGYPIDEVFRADEASDVGVGNTAAHNARGYNAAFLDGVGWSYSAGVYRP